MQINENTASAAATFGKSNIAPKRSYAKGLLNWLAMRDAAYREVCKLREQPEHRLNDMGITRQAANATFYQQYQNHIETRLRRG